MGSACKYSEVYPALIFPYGEPSWRVVLESTSIFRSLGTTHFKVG